MTRKKSEEFENKEITTKEFNVEDIDGIGETRGKRLTEAGITTEYDIIIRGANEIDVITDIGDDEASAIVEKLQAKMTLEGKLPNLDGTGWIEYGKKVEYLNTGSNKLNLALGGFDGEGNPKIGGLETQSVTETYGEEGSGKTQFGFSLLVETVAKGYGVLFVDCEGTYDRDRVLEIARWRGVELDESKIFMERVFDSSRLMRVIDGSTKKIIDNNIRLIIVDGGTGLFRYEYQQGRGDLAPRQNKMKPFFLHLKKMAFWLNLAVLITNQVMGNPDQFSGASIKGIGGHIVGHAPKYILWFKKNSKNKRTVSFEKSNRHPKFDTVLYVNQEGISDSEDLKKPKDVVKVNGTSNKEELS